MKAFTGVFALAIAIVLVGAFTGCAGLNEGKPTVDREKYSGYESYITGDWLSYEELEKNDEGDVVNRPEKIYLVSFSDNHTWLASEYDFDTDERIAVYSGSWYISSAGYLKPFSASNRLDGPYIDGVLETSDYSEEVGSLKVYGPGEVTYINGFAIPHKNALAPSAPEDPFAVTIKTDAGTRLVLHCVDYDQAIQAHKDYLEWKAREFGDAD